MFRALLLVHNRQVCLASRLPLESLQVCLASIASVFQVLQVSDIGIIYITRGVDPNWQRRLLRFAASYLNHPPGVECQLYITFKEFTEGDLVWAREQLAPLEHIAILDYNGFNSFAEGCFAEAVGHITEPLLCTFMATTEIMHDNWLAKLYAVFSRPDVGLVGCTGSLWFITQFFPQLTYPNPHVRDNGIIIERGRYQEIINQFDFKTLHPCGKPMGCFEFEHGPNSMTRQVMAAGKGIYIVEKERILAPHEWPETTYRGNLHNVLVHDRGARDFQDL